MKGYLHLIISRKSKIKNCLIFLLFFFVVQTVFASEPSDEIIAPRRLFIGANAQRGYMFDTRESTVIQNQYISLDLRVGLQTDDFDRDVYDRLFRYPHYGVGLYMGNLDRIVLGDENQAGLGKPLALYAFFASPVVRSDRFCVYYDFSLGLARNFNTYHPHIQPYNLFISTNNNVYLNMQFRAEFALFERSALGFGVSLQHFSNASLQEPNIGVNLVSGTLTYRAGLYKNHEKSYNRFPVEAYSPTWELLFSWANGARMLYSDFDRSSDQQKTKRWYSTSLSTAALIQTSHRRKLGAGLDLFYFDWGRHLKEYRAKRREIQTTTRLRDNMSIGAFVAHEVNYKKIWFVSNVGFYLNDRIGDRPQNMWIYERVGVCYQINKRFSAGLLIKAHLLIADHAELTVRYSVIQSGAK